LGIADINYVPKNNLRFEEGNLYCADTLFKKNYNSGFLVFAPKTQNVNLNLILKIKFDEDTNY